MATPKRARLLSAAAYSSDEWETYRSGTEPSTLATSVQSGRRQRSLAQRDSERPTPAPRSSSSESAPVSNGAGQQNGESDRTGGLSLPDVVRQLLRDPSILKWHPRETVYEVMDGDSFEKRFNELRKVRNKPKAAGTERPFSRMYNFFVLEQGDKWAKTGTRFKPRNATGYPRPDVVKAAEPKKERPIKSSPSIAPQLTSKSQASVNVFRAQDISTTSPCTAPVLRVVEGGPSGPKRNVPTPKMTPQAIRPLGGRNLHILGNRGSPPPLSDLTRMNSMVLEHTEEAEAGSMQHLLGKRHRDYEGTGVDLGPPPLLDLPSARRLRIMQPSAHPALMRTYGPYYAPSQPRYHHADVPLGKDEQSYLYRMRPEVREELMSGLSRPVDYYGRSYPYSSTTHYIQHSAASRRMEMMHSIQHRDVHMSAYHSFKGVHALPPDECHDQEQEHLHQCAHWSCERHTSSSSSFYHHPSWMHRAKRVIQEPQPAPMPDAGQVASTAEDPRTGDGDDADGFSSSDADGFSSSWSTPEGVQSICDDFVGSPLDLGETEGLAALLDGVETGTPVRKKNVPCMGFDEIDVTPWSMEDVACGTSW